MSICIDEKKSMNKVLMHWCTYYARALFKKPVVSKGIAAYYIIFNIVL